MKTMANEGTKEVAEALLRELPSVIGAYVREDVHGHPREVHLLVRAGPNARHLAYDVRDLLEERLGVPIDQRVISIAQLAPGKRPGPLLSAAVGDVPLPTSTAPEPGPEEQPAPPAPIPDPRVRFAGISTEAFDNRLRIHVSLRLGDAEYRGETAGLDTAPARLRAAAAATLQAVDATCVGRARFEVEHVAMIGAFERDYVLVSVLVSSPYLGRRPISLAGAQQVEQADAESAAALAALKAVNRTLSLVLRLADAADPRPSARARR
ncbi:MAG TPA: hypothetical protein VMN60_09300 [Longimicrobiales bacterium]|nr:hypothetical protein [Longimicrobiales bacterium]